MEIKIKIKNVGMMTGTVGDLVRGLDSGDYFFSEGINEGRVGLWMKSKKGGLSQCVAIFNPYKLTGGEICNYDPMRFGLSQTVDAGDRKIWTGAAWNAIVRVAQQWCDERNRELEAEQVPDIHLVRVS